MARYRPQRRKSRDPRWQAVEDQLASGRPVARTPVWWHVWILGHTPDARLVSVPMWDPSAKGLLIDCSCGKGWAK